MLEKPIDPITVGPFCANCQVVISEPWFSKMDKLHHLEDKRLESARIGRTEA